MIRCQRETKIRELSNSSYIWTDTLTSDYEPQFLLNLFFNIFFLLKEHILQAKKKKKKECGSAFTL